MERNDLDSPRRDAQKKHELSGFIQGEPVPRRDDVHLQEEIGDLAPGRRPETAEPIGDHPSIDEQFERQEFARWFRPREFPAPVSALLEDATAEGAPEWLTDALGQLEPGRLYETIGELFDDARPFSRNES